MWGIRLLGGWSFYFFYRWEKDKILVFHLKIVIHITHSFEYFWQSFCIFSCNFTADNFYNQLLSAWTILKILYVWAFVWTKKLIKNSFLNKRWLRIVTSNYKPFDFWKFISATVGRVAAGISDIFKLGPYSPFRKPPWALVFHMDPCFAGPRRYQDHHQSCHLFGLVHFVALTRLQRRGDVESLYWQTSIQALALVVSPSLVLVLGPRSRLTSQLSIPKNEKYTKTIWAMQKIKMTIFLYRFACFSIIFAIKKRFYQILTWANLQKWFVLLGIFDNSTGLTVARTQ